MDHHFRSHGGALYHAALRGQVAFQHGDAAVLGVGVLNGADEFRIPVLHALQVFGNRLSRAGDQGGIQKVLFRQLLHDGVDAARALQVLHVGIPGGGQVAEVGGPAGNLIGHVQVQRNAALVGDGGEVEHGVGGAAQGHVHGFGVVEGRFGHDIPGADVLFHQLHDLHARVLGQPQPGGPDGGDGAVAPEGHTDGLGEAVHGVGGVHAGAGAAGGAGVVLIILHPRFIQLPGVVAAYGLKHVAQAGAPPVVQPSRQHGAAGDKNGGNVQPGGGHEKAGDVLIAVGNHHQPVKLVGNGHGLGGVGDEVPGDKGVLHAHVAHGDAVAHGDGGELHGRASGGPDASLDGFGNLVQVHVAGDDLIIGADHADERAFQLLLGVAQGVKQRTVGSPFDTLGDVAALFFHVRCLLCVRDCSGKMASILAFYHNIESRPCQDREEGWCVSHGAFYRRKAGLAWGER